MNSSGCQVFTLSGEAGATALALLLAFGGCAQPPTDDPLPQEPVLRIGTEVSLAESGGVLAAADCQRIFVPPPRPLDEPEGLREEGLIGEGCVLPFARSRGRVIVAHVGGRIVKVTCFVDTDPGLAPRLTRALGPVAYSFGDMTVWHDTGRRVARTLLAEGATTRLDVLFLGERRRLGLDSPLTALQHETQLRCLREAYARRRLAGDTSRAWPDCP